MEIFNTNYILFSLLGYEVCLLELVGTILGICSVWLATQGKAVNFLVGIVGMSFLTVFFFEKHLYSSVILQIILISFCFWGFFSWKKTGSDGKHQRKITTLTLKQRLFFGLIVAVFVGVWGSVMAFGRGEWLYAIFPGDYHHFSMAYLDAFVLIVAISGMFLRAQKKLENWAVFLSSDLIGVVLYALSGSYFVVLMCSIYLLLDIKALYSWGKELKSYHN